MFHIQIAPARLPKGQHRMGFWVVIVIESSQPGDIDEAHWAANALI
jgi:hypothetical protein